jgi:hypothetical protein
MKSKPIHGLIVLAATFFFAFAPTCGVVGTLLHRAAVFLVGQTGSTLIACTAFVCGVLLIVPVSTWIRFFRWGFAPGRERKTHVREQDTAKREQQARPMNTAKVIPIRPPMLPAVKDARGGLKYLGYSGEEIDSAMDRIEQRGTADEIIRAALKLLRKAA